MRASFPRSGVLRVWQMESGVEQSLEGHQGGIYCLAQGGAYLFSGGEDMCIYTWQVRGLSQRARRSSCQRAPNDLHTTAAAREGRAWWTGYLCPHQLRPRAAPRSSS